MDDLMAQMRKGTTAWIVLAVLRKGGEAYGYGLRQAVFEVSDGLFPIKEGSLYPLLHAMQHSGLIQSRREKIKGRWRHYYRITVRGRRVLADCRRQWKLLHSVLDSLGCHRA